MAQASFAIPCNAQMKFQCAYCDNPTEGIWPCMAPTHGITFCRFHKAIASTDSMAHRKRLECVKVEDAIAEFPSLNFTFALDECAASLMRSSEDVYRFFWFSSSWKIKARNSCGDISDIEIEKLSGLVDVSKLQYFLQECYLREYLSSEDAAIKQFSILS